jgi:3-phosphoglycerate kinase
MNDIRHAKDLRGKKVLVRIDADVPIEDGVVVNPFRLTALLPTITFLIGEGAKVILLGHLGREGASLQAVHTELSKHLTLSFVEDILGARAKKAIAHLADGEVVLLENIRREAGESQNDEELAKHLAALADIYVNEAFSVSHRTHASIVGVPKFLPHYAGIQLQEEVFQLKKARNPEHPSLFILAGAKFETKLPLIKNFVDLYDMVFVGGAIANDFFNAQGLEIGSSLISEEKLDISTLVEHERILLPIDVVIRKGDGVRTTTPDTVLPGERIVDAGPKTVAMLEEKIAQSKSILWNGTLGEYTHGFAEATNQIARILAHTQHNTILGGGDTSAAIADLHLEDKYSFLSTGGGAMLQFLIDGTLPGIEALQ